MSDTNVYLFFQLHSHTQDVVESQILLVLPLTDFIELVHASQTVSENTATMPDTVTDN